MQFGKEPTPGTALVLTVSMRLTPDSSTALSMNLKTCSLSGALKSDDTLGIKKRATERERERENSGGE
jgi:hypothetical protein